VLLLVPCPRVSSLTPEPSPRAGTRTWPRWYGGLCAPTWPGPGRSRSAWTQCSASVQSRVGSCHQLRSSAGRPSHRIAGTRLKETRGTSSPSFGGGVIRTAAGAAPCRHPSLGLHGKRRSLPLPSPMRLWGPRSAIGPWVPPAQRRPPPGPRSGPSASWAGGSKTGRAFPRHLLRTYFLFPGFRAFGPTGRISECPH
jgi:hypothetical protein